MPVKTWWDEKSEPPHAPSTSEKEPASRGQEMGRSLGPVSCGCQRGNILWSHYCLVGNDPSVDPLLVIS